MKKLISVLFLLALVAGLTACNAALNGQAKQIVTPPQAVLADHPTLTEQEKLLPCFECHKDVTPEIYSDWYNSAHGIANVKCYQCHGTFEELTKVPAVDSCSFCHAAEMEHADTTPCWACHLTHKFTGHQK
ncbi:MAG: hypothetical protein B6I36_05410 [Desulfobacteraceae bacterium 4572_35.1]|nr:MAG: hypothetical protein B6I36_05410 [Desulfobacteraceae bacterium 4572_35.1]